MEIGTQGWRWSAPGMVEIGTQGWMYQGQGRWTLVSRGGSGQYREVVVNGTQRWRWPVPWMLEIARNGGGQYQEWWRSAPRDECIRIRNSGDEQSGREVASARDGGDWYPRMDASGPGIVETGTQERRWLIPWMVISAQGWKWPVLGVLEMDTAQTWLFSAPEAATLGQLAGRQTSGHWGRVTWEWSQEPHAASAGGKFIPRQRASEGLGWVDGLALKAIRTPIKPSG